MNKLLEELWILNCALLISVLTQGVRVWGTFSSCTLTWLKPHALLICMNIVVSLEIGVVNIMPLPRCCRIPNTHHPDCWPQWLGLMGIAIQQHLEATMLVGPWVTEISLASPSSVLPHNSHISGTEASFLWTTYIERWCISVDSQLEEKPGNLDPSLCSAHSDLRLSQCLSSSFVRGDCTDLTLVGL